MNRINSKHASLMTVLGLGLAARLAQYLFNRSLWLDEAYLALNILQRDFAGLARPLSDNQIAPPGFLYIEKLLVLILGSSEYALRLFPLIGGIAALLLMYRVARSSLGAHSALIATALLGWSQPAIYFSSEVKPYATDALFALLAYWLYLPLLRDDAPLSRRRAISLGAAGALGLWFSYPLAFVLAAVGVALVFKPILRRDGRRFFKLAIIPLVWGGSLAGLYFAILRQGFANEFLKEFWGDFFATFPPRSLSDIYWFAQLFFDFMVQAGGMPFYGLMTFAWLAGGVVLWQDKRWPLALALALPLFFAMAAAALHSYPFYGRTLLFAVPPTFLLAARGAQAVYGALLKSSRAVAVVFMCVLLFHPLYRTAIVFIQPLTTEEARPVLQYVREHWQPGDQLYVYHGAAPAFAYYAARYHFGDEQSYRAGRSSNGDFAVLAQDIEALRGMRVWYFFVHVYSYGGISEDAFMLDQLKSWPRLDRFSAPGAAVYLYDMRDK